MSPPRLVLASTSRYRRELLDRLGVPYEAVAPAYEEEHDLPLSHEELVVELAERKATSLADRFPDALILGSDQIAVIDDEILLKPGTPARAEAQLRRLAGRTHRLLTGVALHEAATGHTEHFLDIHRMTLRVLTDAQIAAYVASERPVDCAGSYKIEGPGIALFDAMEGRDFTGIVGLPLTAVVALLGRFGWKLP